jgi:uncharacterized protein (UPF0332 family)
MSREYDECLKKGKIRPFSRGKGLAQKEFQAASSDLKIAQETFKNKNYKWATVQLYYSMFHSARSLLYFKNFREHSHFCLIMAIQTLYVETKQIPVTLLEALKEAKNLREDADYYDRWSEEGCRKLLGAAEDFLDQAGKILSGGEQP